MNWPWSELGLDGPASLSEIRHAYAERLKQTHPEEDPEGFQRLHNAYEEARRTSRQKTSPSSQIPPQSTQTHTEPSAQKASSYEKRETEEQADDWDYAQLLEEEQPAAYTSETENTSEGWDFDTLIEPPVSAHSTSREEHKQDWDYDRLFKEEEQRRSHMRRACYSAAENAEELEAVDKVMHILHTLFAERRPLDDWMQFLYCGIFFRVKGSPLFLSELESFFAEHFTIDQGIKHAFLRVYGLDQAYFPKQYHALFHVLTDTTQTPYESILKQKKRTRSIIISLSALFFAFFFVFQIFPKIRLEYTYHQLASYIEEDFGYAVTPRDKTKADKKCFVTADEPTFSFLAWVDGERDLQNGKLGYGTNLGDALVNQKLEQFAKEHEYTLESFAENHTSSAKAAYLGVMPTEYYLDLPLTGAGDSILSLGKLLEDFKKEPWFQMAPPSFVLQLRYRRLSYYACNWPTEPFEAEKVKASYETQVPGDLAMYLIRESGLGKENLGSSDYTLKYLGTLQHRKILYYVIGGAKSETSPVSYLYLYTGFSLCSMKAEEFDEIVDEYFIPIGNDFHSESEAIPRSVLIYQLSE